VTEREPRAGELGFALRDPWAWDDLAWLARLGERLGYAALFLPEIGFRDAFATLVGLAGEAGRLRLGTGVVPIGSRSPETIAMAAATLHERSGGRAIVGLGTGPARPGALEALGDAVARVRAALADAPARDAGPARLDLPGPVPVWIAALGPRAVRLAGAVADGVLLNWCTPDRVAEAARTVAEAAAAAGRDPGGVRVGVYVRASLGPDPDAARDALRRAAGEYASYPAYARQFAAMGLADEAGRAATAHRDGRPSEVPDALVDAVCLAGDVAEARARLAGYRGAGADLPVVYPVPAGDDPRGSVAATLEALAPG
jgi:alkanesulfonate monooxygenase SsuD/methylene tetrahydromethanopterin reductase-like flavin-dependent oxidoreductase (luciferase family)